MRSTFPALLCLLASCGLTVTNERPPYEELEPEEKGAVEVILRELTTFNSQVVEKMPPYNIEQVLGKEHIHVSFEGLIFSWNFGDETIHVATWENLSSEQRSLVGSWFKAESSAAEEIYKKFFYEFMAVTQGAKQFMYNVLTVEWVFGNRTLFSIERDSIETALAHYEAVGRKSEMWTFLENTCAPVREQYDAAYDDKFTKEYFNDNFAELASPENPTGYFYFICRWIEWGKADLLEYNYNLAKMLQWLKELPD